MLFRKKMERSCAYCVHGAHLDDGWILCTKKGMKNQEEKCFRFRYDPLKRQPKKAKPLDFSQYDAEDFSL